MNERLDAALKYAHIHDTQLKANQWETLLLPANCLIDTRLNSHDRMVLVAFAKYKSIHYDDLILPSAPQLARYAGLNCHVIRRCMKKLLELGYLKIKRDS